MVGIIIYGSLLNKKELLKHNIPILSSIPVKLLNYKRVFNQKPSWRKGDGKYKGVLNIIQSHNHHINAIAVILEDKEFKSLDQRERGYVKTKIDVKDIIPNKTYTVDHNIPYYTYTGKPDKQDNSLLPNKNYLDICLKGALDISEEFHNNFLDTTYLGDGRSLNEYIQNLN